MTRHGVEVLLVDDCAADVDLTLRALKERAFVRDVQVARDGEEALDFLFRLGGCFRETVYALSQYWLRMNLAPAHERAILGQPE